MHQRKSLSQNLWQGFILNVYATNCWSGAASGQGLPVVRGGRRTGVSKLVRLCC